MKKFFWVYFLAFFLVMAGIILNTAYKDQTSTAMASLLGKETFHAPDIENLKDDDYGRSVRKGMDIMNNTTTELKGNVGNQLSCVSCHAGGTSHHTLTFVGVADKYPSYSERDGKVNDLADRINGCMLRSMNGKELPKNSSKMKAMVNYITYLSKDVDEPDQASWLKSDELDKLPRASAKEGEELYKHHCMKCHAADGDGIDSMNTPALWGENSFNDGAGMSRNTMATGFIQHAMPKDDPGSLSEHDAAAIAKFINSHDRPEYKE